MPSDFRLFFVWLVYCGFSFVCFAHFLNINSDLIWTKFSKSYSSNLPKKKSATTTHEYQKKLLNNNKKYYFCSTIFSSSDGKKSKNICHILGNDSKMQRMQKWVDFVAIVSVMIIGYVLRLVDVNKRHNLRIWAEFSWYRECSFKEQSKKSSAIRWNIQCQSWQKWSEHAKNETSKSGQNCSFTYFASSEHHCTVAIRNNHIYHHQTGSVLRRLIVVFKKRSPI